MKNRNVRKTLGFLCQCKWLLWGFSDGRKILFVKSLYYSNNNKFDANRGVFFFVWKQFSITFLKFCSAKHGLGVFSNQVVLNSGCVCYHWLFSHESKVRNLNYHLNCTFWMIIRKYQYMMRITNSELYGNLPKVSSKVAQRRLRIAGHAQRHPELTLHSVLLWEPLHGRAGRGRPRQTYIDTLRADTGLQDTRDIANIMEHRERWRDIVHGSREYYPT